MAATVGAGTAAPPAQTAASAGSAAKAEVPARAWSMADDRVIMQHLMVPLKGRPPSAEALQETAGMLAAGGLPCSALQVGQRLEYLLGEFRRRKKA